MTTNTAGEALDLNKLTRWTFDGGMTAAVSADGQWVSYSDLRAALARAGSAAPAGQQAEPVAVDAEALRDAVTNGLRGLWGCGRVWSAWNVGTMGEEDFYAADESDECIDQVIDALAPILAAPTAAEGLSAIPEIAKNFRPRWQIDLQFRSEQPDWPKPWRLKQMTIKNSRAEFRRTDFFNTLEEALSFCPTDAFRRAAPLATKKGAGEVDAKDAVLAAARKWIVKNRPAITLSRQATIDEYLYLLKKIDAAIAAQPKDTTDTRRDA